MHINSPLRLAVIVTAVIMSGCSTAPMQPEGSAPAQQLFTQADTLQQNGDIKGSIAQVERIVRLEPRNAYAWHRLATLHLANGELNKAEQFARRSNQYAAGNKALIAENQKVIDEVASLRAKQTP